MVSPNVLGKVKGLFIEPNPHYREKDLCTETGSHIIIKDLSIGYNGVVIRDGLSFQIKQNKIYGILGESGAGKTTLLKTIAGLIKPINGQLLLGIEQNQIYMMHQAYTSFDWLNCVNNILITEKVKHHRITSDIKQKAIQSLNEVGLGGYEKKYPTQLSGGQRQRLALARTFFTNPKVILMDEPLSALDEETRVRMQDLILQKHKEVGSTIIMVTHSSAEAERMCDNIIKF